MTDSIVLLSGGQDSTTCLFAELDRGRNVRALTLTYGQRHASEVDAARRVAAIAGVPHDVHHLAVLSELGGSALVDGGKLTADGGRADDACPGGLPSSFVPGRNLVFLAVAAAYAVRWGAHTIVTGVCQTDYSGYPDCRREFVDAMELAAALAMPSSSRPLRIETPLMLVTKAETVAMARRIPGCWEAIAQTVTCYEGMRPGCGECPACLLRARGFADAGEVDPCATA
jgi:7-cyano-7-deazaguanine synthase